MQQSSTTTTSSSLFWTMEFLDTNKTVQVSWLTASATPCVEISSSATKVRLNLEQWTNLKNYAPTITMYFITSVIPSDVHPSVQFITQSGKPHLKLENRIIFTAANWVALVNSFESIDSALNIVKKLDDSEVNYLIDSFVDCLYHDEKCPKFTTSKISFTVRGCGGCII